MKNSFSIFVTQNSKFPFVRFSKLLSGYAYYKNYRINLISQEKEVTSISDFLKECESIKCDNNFKKPRVFHLFYELQHILYNTNISENCLLAIDLCYDHVDYLKDIKADHCKIKSINKVEFEGYKTKFKKGYQELLKGNCYQFNLTEKFDFHINTHNPYDIIGTLWKNKQARAPYGHASFLPSLNKLLISNSPESLFEITKKKQSLSITTRPIKGTISREESIEKSWRLLLDSEKDRAELYMITDLMRNDLSRIQKPNAKVIKKRSKLLVPGLIHQYSLIEAILDTTVDLYQVIKSLLPGGSVP
ncbi:MAG: chorismate-binding protein, partial [Bacteriovoracaceae bacterium]